MFSREGSVPAILIAVLIASLYTVPASAHDGPTTFGFGAVIGMQIADLSTTHAVVARGGFELNPVMRGGVGRQIAVKSALTASTWVIASKITSPRRRRLFVYSIAAIYSAAAISNAAQLRH